MDTMHTLQSLVHALHTFGDKPCLLALHHDGIARWSYAEVDDHVQRLAHGLARIGVGRGDYVALLATNRPEWVIACLAVIGAGAAIVPLDTGIRTEALEGVLHDSAARFIFTTTEYLNRLQQLDRGQAIRTILLDVAADDERGWRVLLTDTTAALPSVEPDEPAALFYTSGTTGTPKGVPLTHRNLAFQLRSVQQAKLVDTHDRVLLPLPMYHVYPFTIGLLTPLFLGLPIVLPQALTGPQLIRALREGEVTIMIGVPRLYRALYEGIEAQVQVGGPVVARLFKASMNLSIWLRRRLRVRAGQTLFRSLHKRFGGNLRMVASGGSALDPDLAWKLEGLGWRVAIGYGLTETAPLLTMNLPMTAPLLSLRRPAAPKLASVGTALSGIEIRIDTAAYPAEAAGPQTELVSESRFVQPSQTKSAAPEQGEILARGTSVFAGYRNLPAQTAEAFTEDGWFRTGDLGYLDAEGYVYITGRASTLIVTEGGKNVQPEPVEEVYQNHVFIREIGMLQQDQHLVALIMPEMDEVNQQRNGDVERAVREAVNAQAQLLPSYQRITDYAITPEPLPRTNLGKIRRHVLAELYTQVKQGVLPTETANVGPIPIADMSEADRVLLEHPAARQVWDWLANRYPDRRLTPDTSPQLDLGVDSLAWLNLTLEISERTGAELSGEAIARISTVRDLLQEVNMAAEGEEATASAIEHPEEVLTAEQQAWLDPVRPALRVLGVVVFMLLRVAARLLFRVEARGLAHLPDHGNFVLTPNHTSYLDPPVIASVLSYNQMRQTYWAGSTDVMFQLPIMRLISRMAQVMPVAGKAVGTGLSSLAFAAITLKRKKNLVWFPEGRVATTADMLPFREGIGIVLEHYPVPVVPVFIQGAREALPLGSLMIRPRKVTLTFGPPCDPRELAQQGQGDTAPARIANALQQRVAALAEQSPVMLKEQP